MELMKMQLFKPRKNRIKVLHIVKHFYAGGAERMVSSVLRHSDKEKYEHIVLSLSDASERLANIRSTLNIPYKSINFLHKKLNYINYLNCILFIWRMKPDIIKTWLPSSNITGGIIGFLLRIPVIWGIHDARRLSNKVILRQVALSKKIPRKIICCSKPVYDTCLEYGYDKERLEIITNGTDTDIFHYSAEGRKRIRQELGVDENTILIGMAAECLPLKRHKSFLVSAKLLLSSYPNARFLFCGRGTNVDPLLTQYISFLDMEQHVYRLGIRDDMHHIFSALDIHTLNSSSEAFGLAVTEAMACKTLCVATDVGIMKELLHEVGETIPISENPIILTNAWKYMIELSKKEISERREKGHDRIVKYYSIIETAKKYDAAYSYVNDENKERS